MTMITDIRLNIHRDNEENSYMRQNLINSSFGFRLLNFLFFKLNFHVCVLSMSDFNVFLNMFFLMFSVLAFQLNFSGLCKIY